MTDHELSDTHDKEILETEGAAAPGTAEDISVLELLVVLAKRKWLIVSIPLLFGLVAAVVALTQPPVFTAVTKLLPPQQSISGAGAVLGQLGGQFGALASGAAGVLGLRNPGDVYVAILKSRTIADAMIDRFQLASERDVRSDVRQSLASASRVSVGLDGLITVEVEHTDPKWASTLANGYVEELIKLTSVIAVTEASQRRLFLEQQLQQAKENLFKVELAAREAMEQGGLAMVDTQGRSMIQTNASFRSRIASKEVEINTLRRNATEQNPQLVRAQQELAALREQVAKLERGGDDGFPAARKDSKGQGIKNVALMREMQYQESLFQGLARQYEVAKIEEARDNNVIQVLDQAVEPDRRTRPRRTFMVLVSAAVGLMVAILAVFLLEGIERARHSPADSRRLNLLKRHLIGARETA
jgi:tyrosine-protein kinase Etk/Wzc